ncbi:hypothetical protein C4D60_Mb08t13370 [Musa balbisiana]|uniref:Uncharacterized protein n=1 Tax=Musa balbisiana TaxID=52838 RepID=A0A4S8K3G3_MUSBA|nr:hypothetical protein C4D60_Mb08t13370 [Musa balbisiana]
MTIGTSVISTVHNSLMMNTNRSVSSRTGSLKLAIRVGSPRTANVTVQYGMACPQTDVGELVHASGNATVPIRKPSRLSSPSHGSRLGDQRGSKLFGRKQSVYRNLSTRSFFPYSVHFISCEVLAILL